MEKAIKKSKQLFSSGNFNLAPLTNPINTNRLFFSPKQSNKSTYNLNAGFTKENIHKVYTFPFLITKDSKLIAFQYITHHILPTKSSLFRAGITENDTCTLCKTEKQTTNHLLFHCTESNAFWLEFTSWWRLKYKQVITLTVCVVLYGYHNSIKNKQALNVTLLLAKYHIFATSSCDGKLSFESFLLRLQNHLEILNKVIQPQTNHVNFFSIYGNVSLLFHSAFILLK